jgi:hypothetical protein
MVLATVLSCPFYGVTPNLSLFYRSEIEVLFNPLKALICLFGVNFNDVVKGYYNLFVCPFLVCMEILHFELYGMLPLMQRFYVLPGRLLPVLEGSLSRL